MEQQIKNLVDRAEMILRVRQLSEEIRDKVGQLRELVKTLGPESIPVDRQPRVARLSSTYDYPPAPIKL